jgi:hypothetical protein
MKWFVTASGATSSPRRETSLSEELEEVDGLDHAVNDPGRP